MAHLRTHQTRAVTWDFGATSVGIDPLEAHWVASRESHQASLVAGIRCQHGMIIEVLEGGISTCRSKGPKGEACERTHDYVIASRILRVKIKKTEVLEDVESRPHKAVTFLVERDKLFQDTAVGNRQGEGELKEGE